MQNIVASCANGTVELSHNIIISKSSPRQTFESNQKYVLSPNLVDKNNIYLQPLRIKLELLKFGHKRSSFRIFKVEIPNLIRRKSREKHCQALSDPSINTKPRI
jgi:hypothetical protein